MRPFIIRCSFGGETADFPFYIGRPVDDAHPLEQQIAFLARERGGRMPAAAADGFADLHAIALAERVPLEELVVWAMGKAETVEHRFGP
ncbi:DUF2610 domain-containing protein [Kitasatospora sp. NPDC089913]|uniref:DUF2610 domain-containing protein n=1 Tax=Kitasatospora sp. NPDC089913 TaxID=3364080 RepID=UPI0037FBBB63